MIVLQIVGYIAIVSLILISLKAWVVGFRYILIKYIEKTYIADINEIHGAIVHLSSVDQKIAIMNELSMLGFECVLNSPTASFVVVYSVLDKYELAPLPQEPYLDTISGRCFLKKLRYLNKR